MNRYDVIGDVHGCADELEALLAQLGYAVRDGAYRHPDRTAVFVGDLIDRGPAQLRVLQIVKAMVDAGSARMVLGNHEFNALAYATEWPRGSGKYLRPHDDPDNPDAAKNERQHAEFLEQVTGEARAEYLAWFRTQPLWLDLGGIRVVHACWHEASMAALGDDRISTDEQLVRASTKGDPIYEAVETLLKGPEISLLEHRQPPYLDKDGHSRGAARLRWWNETATTLADLAEISSTFTTEDHQPYPALPEVEVMQDFVYEGKVPVFYGHYWRQGSPRHLHDWTDYAACVDFSAVKGGALTAYRWSGETRIDPAHYVWVGSSVG
ncbi:metallophosphoesterase [Mycolicibacterium frederiksbergense]|uniref:metallophosphoesterase n=1 Tax=Mycolicibacterium frederiksbergense TaxID=117567 RepID=UPI00265BBD86|nr:metallophosphoesterase [Mycolicibacterium frederiksbergense]MDO0977761.1 metallophosphoesterase [Mycolicibacterium frederiksbergense]